MANKILAFAHTTIKSIKDAKSLDLTASRQAIAFDKDNNAKDSTAVTLTATQQNFTDSITWSTSPNVTLSGTGNTRTLAISNFTNNNQIKVTITAGGLSDSVTIAKIKDGATGAPGNDAYTVVLSNESQTIATDTGLKPLSAATYSCNVTVYRGTTKLTATTSTPSTNQFKVTLPSNPTGITLGQSTAGTVTFATTTSTAISANTNINLTIQINGLSGTLTRTISLSASKQGNTGATGNSATAYWLISSASAIGKNTSNVFNPASVTFNLKSQTGTNAVANYSGRLIIAESTDGTNFTNKYTSSSDESSKTYSLNNANVKSIRVRMYKAGGTTNDTTLLDEQIIPIVIDGTNGAPAVTAVLSNDSHSIPCNSSGSPSTYAGAVTTMSVFVGASDTSSSWTYTVAATNVTGTSSNSNRTYTVTGISADIGYVDITAKRSGYSSITKRFTLTKTKHGATGNTGAQGPQGPTGPTGPQGPQGEAKDYYDATFMDGKKYWSKAFADAYDEPGTNVIVVKEETSKGGGNVLQIQNDTWLYARNKIAIEEGRVYKFSFRVRQIQDPLNGADKNKVYAGATTFNAAGKKLSPNNGTYFIASSQGVTVANGWKEYTVYMSTTARAKLVGTDGKDLCPAVKAFDSGTKAIKPMFIVNYSGGNGIAQVDYLTVEDYTQEWNALNIAKDKLNNDSQKIFDMLTEEGKKQGLFMESDKLYINGQFISAKNLTVTDNDNRLTFGVDENGNVTIRATTLEIGTKPVASKEYIDTMQIGGRNLIPNTSFVNGTLNWKDLNSSKNLTVTEGRTLDSKALEVTLTGDKTGQGAWSPFGPCMPSTKYISSCWVKPSVNAKVGQYIKYKINPEDAHGDAISGPSIVWTDAKANTWTYISQTFTTPDNVSVVATTPRVKDAATGTFIITELKIEEGTKPTVWSIAPEDLENGKVNVGEAAADINASDTQIEYAKLNIKGAISFSDLDKNMSTNFKAQTNPATGEVIETLINGAKIETGTLKGDQINTKGLTCKDTKGNTTFDIDSDSGVVTIRGTITSTNYSDVKGQEAGYELTPSGDAYLNNAILRGSVILPQAGVTNEDTKGALSDDDHVRFWAGSDYENRHEAPFQVLQDGTVKATEGDFGGTITGKLSIGNIHIEDTNDTQGFIQIRNKDDKAVLVHLEETNSFINSELEIGNMISFKPSENLMEGPATIKLAKSKYELTIHSGNDMLKSTNGIGIHRQTYMDHGGYTFESSGSNTDSDYCFRRADYNNENATVKILGNIYLRNALTAPNKIDMVVKTDSGNSGYDFVVKD